MEKLVKHHEAISALADGELSADELTQTMARLGDSQDDRLTWLAYHVTGDVIRGGPSLAGGAETAFMQRLKLSLAQESPSASVDPEVEIQPIGVESVRSAGQYDLKNEAANDGYFRWKWMAGLASVVMVSLVGWLAVGNLSNSSGGAEWVQQTVAPLPATLAVASAPLLVPEAPVMLRDPQLDALMVAHRQFGGASALQMPTGFLRNATFDGAAR